jgi:hypothetical protein
MNTPEPSTPEDWLRPLVHYVRWTAWEVVSIFSDLPPVAPEHAAPPTREQLIEQARGRADAERHVRDAIQQGGLIVDRGLADRQLLDALKSEIDDKQRQAMARVIAAHQLYEPWKVEPSVAIRFFLSRQDLFPRCRLTEDHLAIAQAAITRSSAPVDVGQPEAKADPLGDLIASTRADHGARNLTRTDWLDERLGARGLTVTMLSDRAAVDRGNISKWASGRTKKLSPGVKGKLAKVLGVPTDHFPD